MAKRLISAAIGVIIGVTILWLDMKELFLIAVAIVSVACVYEILVATKYIVSRSVTIFSLSFSCIVPFVLSYDTQLINIIDNTRYVAFAFIIGLFVIMLFRHTKIKFAQVAIVAFVSLCIPISMTCLIFMYDLVNKYDYNSSHRIFCLVYTLTITWMSDTGAFFIGTFLGKHKMAPNISPKKSWEGFAGGLVTALLFGFFLGKGYEWWTVLFSGELTFEVDVWFLALLAIPCAILGVLGDFSASLLKRECAVKDFGSIMPGHGGFLDRFDSVLFVLPFVYLVFDYYFPVKDIV
jgi:phosphatidate cytidylyltransferase